VSRGGHVDREAREKGLVITTAPIGGSTGVSLQGIMEVVAENIESLEKGRGLRYLRTQ